MKEKELNTKIIRKYWKEVVIRAFKPLWAEMTMRVVIITVVLLLLIMGISGIFLTLGWTQVSFLANRITEFQVGLSTFSLTLAVFVVLFILSIYSVPAKMYDELGGFIENPFLLRARPPLPKHQSEERYASIDVINTSHVTIEKCFLTLDDILDNDGNSIIYSQ